MGSPLLATKFHVPAKRATFVPRRRLTERLDLGAAARLTLVSAPAGFGKTTLLADWLSAAAAGGRAVAWLSLDPADSDPAVFWSGVAAAVRGVKSQRGVRPGSPGVSLVLAAVQPSGLHAGGPSPARDLRAWLSARYQ